ncbi:hypothetical protein [Rudaea cellulosilytica]|uniref:hypothetical protein n=1 Tax=Rudaea cellulosilytica TaxID=540746 RepID=UPI0003623CE1|nr:hypothetical protein [Rudaea cellulosilytica]
MNVAAAARRQTRKRLDKSSSDKAKAMPNGWLSSRFRDPELPRILAAVTATNHAAVEAALTRWADT